MSRTSGRRLRLAVIALVTTMVIVGGGVALYVHFRPYLHGTNCEARTSTGVMPLDLDQAANAATIAAVALRKKLPEQAVVIAYATALQESHLRNLESGDRDSVGLFQQRPSQGWGTSTELKDPVYAANRFFSALVKVKDYTGLPVHDAAQKVQRSADGKAYARHEDDARIMAAAYTGRVPGAVRCWYPPNKRKKQDQARQALADLRKTLKRKDTGDGITAPNARSGWTIATWMVAHAQPYGIHEVRYAGRRWRSAQGHDGWTKDDQAPSDRVLIS
ncbi:hypothetical protein [Actinoallomurus rhizosphaericola]|uniref:hypothetical protein n=1 Tax=Actinoallomurus rhizosphaericola TaxID=2952536 RepID=UPI002090E94D|nr:hypothetical protein [Actinoallomurus rhizosphaericola]MCO5992603.1 hypothetical protein [Actinoallomurus rhizosphaericola]